MATLAYSLYLFSLVFTPVAFGTEEVWSQTILNVSLFTALLLLAVNTVASRHQFRPTPGIVPLSLFLGWTVFQLIPLPVGLIALLSPQTLEIYQPYLALEPNVRFLPITVHPLPTMYQFFRYSAFAAIYFLTVQLLIDKKRVERTVTVVVVVCLLICLQAILQYFTDNTKIYWYRELIQSGGIFGAFAYKNHFAGYVLLSLPVSFGLMHYYRPKRLKYSRVRMLFAEFFNHRGAGKYLFFTTCVSILLTAIFLSGSRGGAICAILSIVLWYVFSRKRLHCGTPVPLLLALVACIAMGLGTSGLQKLDQRLGEAGEHAWTTANGRTPYWQSSMEMISDSPVTGTGTGTFCSLYPSYMKEVGRSVRLAHNDVLEILVDGGIIAGILWFMFLYRVLSTSANQAKSRRSRLSLVIYSSSLAGILAFFCHGMVETHLKGASAGGLTFFFLLGLNVASSTLSSRATEQSALVPRQTGGIFLGSLPIALATLLVMACTVYNGKTLLQPNDFNPKSRMRHNLTEQEAAVLLEDASTAISHDPLNAIYYVAQGFGAYRLGDKAHALESYKRAMQLNPTDALALFRVAQVMEAEGDLEQTEKFYRFSIDRHPTRYLSYFFLASWLVDNQRMDEGLANYKKAFTLDPGLARKFIPILAEEELTPEQVQHILPDRVDPHLIYARWLAKKGETERAEAAYAAALTFTADEDTLKPDYFIEPSRFYIQHDAAATALGILLQAITALPNDYRLRLNLGDLYKKQSMTHKAVEQYQQALRIKPGDEKAQQRLDY